MSDPSVATIFRSPGAWAAGVLGQDCALCGVFSRAELICAACARDLPRADAACPRCAAPMAGGAICGACLASPPAFERAVAAFRYRFPVDRLVQRFKSAGDLALGHWLAVALARRVEREARPALLVAPPLSAERLRGRGFNQGLELAKAVGRALALPVARRGLARTPGVAPQQGLGRKARRANVRAAFRCALDLRGCDVAIVDDVMTTGATAEAMSAALRAAGARQVSVWVVARTPGPQDAEG